MALFSKLAPIALSVALVSSMAAPASAQETPVVKMRGDLCPAAYYLVETWGKTFARNAALAAPTLRSDTPVSCDDPAVNVQGAHSVNAATLKQAKRKALAVCNAARPAESGRCVIIAYMER